MELRRSMNKNVPDVVNVHMLVHLAQLWIKVILLNALILLRNLIAPSIATQFYWATLPQVITGCKELGFTHVVEAALGADIVALNEAKDLSEEGFATSSCCPAFVRYIKTEFPTLVDKISNNLSPMATIAKYIKMHDTTAKTVFVGPCMAKKMEIQDPYVAPYVDCVITFEELAVLFEARNIALENLPESALESASYFGRIFARSGGLSEAVKQALLELNSDFVVQSVKVSGLDQCRTALLQAKNGKLQGNFLEGMACPNGCIGGPCALSHSNSDMLMIDKYGRESTETMIKESVDALNISPKIATKRQ